MSLRPPLTEEVLSASFNVEGAMQALVNLHRPGQPGQRSVQEISARG